jgi:hypothetical protein
VNHCDGEGLLKFVSFIFYKKKRKAFKVNHCDREEKIQTMDDDDDNDDAFQKILKITFDIFIVSRYAKQLLTFILLAKKNQITIN